MTFEINTDYVQRLVADAAKTRQIARERTKAQRDQKRHTDTLTANYRELRRTDRRKQGKTNYKTRKLIELSLLVTEHRITQGTLEDTTSSIFNTEAHLDNNISDLKCQLEALRDLCEMHEEEARDSAREVAQHKQLKEQAKEYCELEVEKTQEQVLLQEKQLLDQIAEITIQLEVERRESQVEIQVKELINNRQTELISQIKDEIKNVKYVLQDRRLKKMYHQKLSEHKQTHTRMTRSAKPARMAKDSAVPTDLHSSIEGKKKFTALSPFSEALPIFHHHRNFDLSKIRKLSRKLI